MNRRTKSFIIISIAALLVTTGCIGGIDEALDRAGGVNSTDGNVDLYIDAANVPDGLAHVGFEFDQAYLHDAASTPAEGYFNLDLVAERADPVTGDDMQETHVATGDLPASEYDLIRIELNAAQVHGEAHMGGHDDHGDHGDQAEDHGDHAGHEAGAPAALADVAFEPEAFELILPVSFDLTADAVTEIRLVLDVENSVTDASYRPTFDVEITRGGDTISEETVEADVQVAPSGHVFDTQPPAARISVFAPDGDRLFEPSFDAEDDVFANQMHSAFPVGEEARFTATESEALEEGAAIEEEHWAFGDGSTATGTAATHAYEEPGAYEVTLTLVDSYGAVDTHTVRVVVANWTDALVDTHFEDGEGEWSVNTTGQATTWALSGEGYQSGPSWHATAHDVPLAYEPETTTVLSSPTFEIPEDWLQAGFSVHIMGGVDEVTAACVPSTLDVSYTAGDTTETIGTFTSEPEWIELGGVSELDEYIGEEITFNFAFATSCNPPQGDGWFMDAFHLGGISQGNFANAHLLAGLGAGDGHDHAH